MLRDEITSFVDNHSQEQLEFIIRLCNENSYTYNKRGTDRVAEMVLERLASLLSFHVVVDQKEVGCHHILTNRQDGKAVYLVGHLDTVFAPEHEFSTCRVEGALLYGPGTCDMKGGIGVMVYALKALQEIDALHRINLALILNSDEEIGSVTSRPLFEEERRKATACLVAECAGNKGEIVVSRNGKMGARIDCYGQDRHVSTVTDKKASAILELSHRIVALESLNGFVPGVNVNVGKIEGGLGPATVPKHASALVDARWMSEEHHSTLKEQIEKSLSENSQPGCCTQFTVLNLRPAMPCTRETGQLQKLIQETGRRLGQSIGSEHRRGTSDANFFAAAGVPTVDGLGPIGQGDHTNEEHVDIESITERTVLLASVLLELSSK